MKIHRSLLKSVSPEVPEETRLNAAKGKASLAPGDLVTVLFALSYSESQDISRAARKSLMELPVESLLSALEQRLDPMVLRKIAVLYRGNDAVLTMVALNPGIDDETLEVLARKGPLEVAYSLASETERLKEKPFLLEALKKNPALPKYVLEKGAGPEPPTQATEEQLAEIKGDPDKINVFQLIQRMSVAQKIKAALTGDKAVRDVLIRDRNKAIASAVLKNPRMTEDEVLKLVTSKTTPDDMLRHIARKKDWVKNYNVKLGMVLNAKTPLSVSLKYLDYLYEKDLIKIAKSKNIPSVLASTAMRKMETKKK